MLEALLKRVDGLEAKLKEKNATEKTTEPASLAAPSEESSSTANESSEPPQPKVKRLAVDTSSRLSEADESAIYSPAPARYGMKGKPLTVIALHF